MKRAIITVLMAATLLSAPIYAATPMVGGWSTTTDSKITVENNELFQKAMAEQSDVTYVPLELLATQVVAGTNYCFLCRVMPEDSDSTPGYAYVYIYEDLQGDAKILDVQDISFGVRPVYRITIDPESEEFLAFECPESAMPGDTVVLKTSAGVCDGDMFVSVNGDKDFGSFTSYGVYEFVMPDSDVEIKYWVEGNGLA